MKIPESKQFYYKPDSIKDPELRRYISLLIRQLNSVYAELAAAINENRDDYDAHTTHPPG